MNVSTLSNFQQNFKLNLLNLYLAITRSDVSCPFTMGSCLRDLVNDIIGVGNLKSDLTEDATVFLEAWKRSLQVCKSYSP
eukprot:c32543_g1_i1 orf=2-241(+)